MPSQHAAAADVSDLPPERTGVALRVPPIQGPTLTPEAQLFVYKPDEWEDFVYEWARTLDGYLWTKRFGGANDHGVDVAGFRTSQGFEGAWDCFQCKHYQNSLAPKDAYPEILKVLRYAFVGYYSLPQTYAFMAPRGAGPTLAQLLLKPSALRTLFLGLIADREIAADLGNAERARFIKYVKSVDFSIFKSFSSIELLEQHRKSPHHSLRFDVPLPAPPAFSVEPPVVAGPEEFRYLQQLFEVYTEKYGTHITSLDSATLNAHTQSHLAKQREYFFCAEKFRMFYRDKVPAGTFEHLQAELQEGVQEVHDFEHASGFNRLQAVLTQSQVLHLTTNALISVWQSRDKKGICHQLANVDRLTWCQ